jgi:apolipoprotein N-acyltransferase
MEENNDLVEAFLAASAKAEAGRKKTSVLVTLTAILSSVLLVGGGALVRSNLQTLAIQVADVAAAQGSIQKQQAADEEAASTSADVNVLKGRVGILMAKDGDNE